MEYVTPEELALLASHARKWADASAARHGRLLVEGHRDTWRGLLRLRRMRLCRG